MNKQDLINHLRAYSAAYCQDAAEASVRGNRALSQFLFGKSEAFATAASWLEVSAV